MATVTATATGYDSWTRGETVFTTNFWQCILDQPDASQRLKDIAHTNLNDVIGMGGIQRFEPINDDADTVSEENPPDGWIYVEFWNRNDPRVVDHLSPIDAVIVAGQAYLSAEEESHKLLPLIVDPNGATINGRPSAKASYIKLYEAAQSIIKNSNNHNEEHFSIIKNAYIVMAMLESKDNNYKKALQLHKKAVNFDQNNDWRLRSRLGTYYMCNNEINQSYQCLVQAEEMALASAVQSSSSSTTTTTTPEDAAFFAWQISINKAKVLCSLERNEEARNNLECVMTEYDTIHKNNPRGTTHRLVGHLAVAQYMLSMFLAMEGTKKQLMNARRHFLEAETKRNSIPSFIAKNIDWGNRAVAQMLLQGMASSTNNTSNHVQDKINRAVTTHNGCHQCSKVTTKIRNCEACKQVRYCSKECQIKGWKNGHKKECKILQQR